MELANVSSVRGTQTEVLSTAYSSAEMVTTSGFSITGVHNYCTLHIYLHQVTVAICTVPASALGG